MSSFEPVEVSARWEAGSGFIPTRFTWQGRAYLIESTGRRWEDEAGLHVLCMPAGGKVFELLFRLNPAGWLVKPPPVDHHV